LQSGNDGSTAVGSDSLSGVTTGIYNVSVGGSTGSSINTGSYNTIMGYGALAGGSTSTSSSNVAIGYNAMATAGVKSNNVAIGRDALVANTTGGNNVAIGRDALGANTTTSNLTAVGYQALLSNTTGEENTAVGYQALYTNTTNYRCTAIGWKAGFSSTGAESIFIGYRAGQSVTTGSANVLVGPYAGEYQNAITTGSNNVVLSYAGGIAAGTDTHEIFINTVYNASGKGSSTGFINPNGGGVYQGNNSSSWSVTSDQRLKKNIVDNNVGLDAINAIRVRNFEYRVAEEITELSQDQVIKKAGVQLGVIAQELQTVLPDCVKQESTGILSVDSDNLTWYLINAVKQLSAQVDTLKSEIATLKGA